MGSSTLPFSIANPLEFPRWNESLHSLPGSSFFHTSSWAETLHRSYRYQPFYFTIDEGGGGTLAALLPCMGIDSALTGKRGSASLSPIIANRSSRDAPQFQALFSAAVAHGKSQG